MNEEFREEMTKGYLADRSYYRSTGIPKKVYKRSSSRTHWWCCYNCATC